MISMAVDGSCTASRNGAVFPTGNDVVEMYIDGVALKMCARRVSCVTDLDASDRLLDVLLPMPFGKYLVFAPVLWRCEGSVSLTAQRLHEMLTALRSTHRASVSRAVVLQACQDDTPPSEDEEDEDDEEEHDEEDDEGEEEEEDDEEEGDGTCVVGLPGSAGLDTT